MSDYFVSLIRTWIPIAVGAALTWAAANLDVVIDEESSRAAIGLCVSILTGAYYAIVRALEQRFPQVGWLLGTPTPPQYPQHSRGDELLGS